MSKLELGDFITVTKDHSGTDGYISFCTREEILFLGKKYKLGKIWSRNNNELVSCSIKTNKKGKRIVFGKNQKMINNLLRFVEENEYLLWGYWCSELRQEPRWYEVINKFVSIKKK